MRTTWLTAALVVVLGFSALLPAEDDVAKVTKAVEQSTLNQSGTEPFHLRASLSPSRDQDSTSGRTGEIEIWWVSPTQWKREVRSPEFHQVAIKNGIREWQKNEGDFFPDWLREVAQALIMPVPDLAQTLEQVKGADVKTRMGSTYYSWIMMSSDGQVQKGMGGSLSITDKTGLLFYGGGLGWGALFRDYKSFHGRMVARTVSSGSPEVTAKVSTLEDFKNVPSGFFDVEQSTAETSLLRTVIVEETALRKNLLPRSAIVWPSLQDGPLQGALTTEIVVDRAGVVRDVGTIVSDNPGVGEQARKSISQMRFSPYLENGEAVQVVSRITMPFKSSRPAGVETFKSALSYFESGRHSGFPAAGTGAPYLLKATFQVKTSSGRVENGNYADTWKNDEGWRREATIGVSRFVRTRDGEKRYQLSSGPDAALLAFVLKVMEPIPAIDTFVESDWKIKRDSVDDIKAVRVLAGYESPDGKLDPVQARGYWFDEVGRLVKTYSKGIETRRLGFEEFGGVEIAREIRVSKDGMLGMLIRVTQVTPAATIPDGTFEVQGHEWNRAFTDQVR
jgi:hypothetical protein